MTNIFLPEISTFHPPTPPSIPLLLRRELRAPDPPTNVLGKPWCYWWISPGNDDDEISSSNNRSKSINVWIKVDNFNISRFNITPMHFISRTNLWESTSVIVVKHAVPNSKIPSIIRDPLTENYLSPRKTRAPGGMSVQSKTDNDATSESDCLASKEQRASFLMMLCVFVFVTLSRRQLAI